jgi:SsrA-binding protein
MQIISNNKKAYHDYTFFDKFEAGIVLKGTEVKSIRTSGCTLADSYVMVEKMQAFIHNLHIPEFAKSSYFKAEPKRTRKLLLNKQELKKLTGLITQKGLTIIPTKIYFSDKGFVKLEIATAKGTSQHDKRTKIKNAIVDREIAREMKNWRVKG